MTGSVLAGLGLCLVTVRMAQPLIRDLTTHGETPPPWPCASEGMVSGSWVALLFSSCEGPG